MTRNFALLLLLIRQIACIIETDELKDEWTNDPNVVEERNAITSTDATQKKLLACVCLSPQADISAQLVI